MKRTVGAIAAATATFASAVGLVTTGGWLISEAALRPPLLVLQVAIVSVRAFGIARGSFRWLERVVSHDAALHETVERRAALWASLADAGPRGAWVLRRGDAITRLMQDAEVLQDRVTRVIVPAVAAIITALGAAALQWHLQPVAGAAFFGALVIAGVAAPILTHRVEYSAARAALHERSAMNAALSEYVAHRDEMRALGIVDELTAYLTTIDRARIAIETRASLLAGATQLAALVATGLAIVAACIASVPAVLDESLQGPHLAVVVLLPWSATEVIAALAAAASAAVRVRSAQQRLDEVRGLAASSPALEADGQAGLHVRNLVVRWGDIEVVHGANFSVHPGERVALVGPSGAGKSSIVGAVLGLVDYVGSVAVGGVVAGTARAHCISAVLQAPHMFRTTVRENLRLAAGPAVSDQELTAALVRVELDLPLDRDLALSPLSGGEALRLGVARALLVPAPVLVLDEPTEHLDEATAASVMETIVRAAADRALLLTTHRVTDLRDFDRVIVLDAGRMMVEGPYEECRARNAWFSNAIDWRLDKARGH